MDKIRDKILSKELVVQKQKLRRREVKFDLKKEIDRISNDTLMFAEKSDGIDAITIMKKIETAKKITNVKEVTLKNFVSWSRNIIDGGIVQLRKTIIFSKRAVTYFDIFNESVVNEKTVEVIETLKSSDGNYLILRLTHGVTLVDELFNVLYMISSSFSAKKLEDAYFGKLIKLTNYFYFKPVCVRDCILLDPTRTWNIFARRIDREILELLPVDQLNDAIIELTRRKFEVEEVTLLSAKEIDTINVKNLKSCIVLKFEDRFEDMSNSELGNIYDMIDRLDQLVDPKMLTFSARIYPLRGLVFMVM